MPDRAKTGSRRVGDRTILVRRPCACIGAHGRRAPGRPAAWPRKTAGPFPDARRAVLIHRWWARKEASSDAGVARADGVAAGADRGAAGAQMTTGAARAAFPRPVNSVLIAGGQGAPARARRYLLAQLDAGVSASCASDAALIVSELVTNSVIHAHVGADEAILLELTALGDRLRIAVIDPGSLLEPRIVASDSDAPGGFGLRLVRHMSSAWGVVRNDAGTTSVWCDLPLDPIPSS
jgi:anti-sigma regulatory factor (Ser/Thr protein kinase)